MTIFIEHLPVVLGVEELSRLECDTIVMTSEERRWCRRRASTTQGREIVLALPTGTILEPGSVIAIQKNWYLRVEAAPENVLAVRPCSREQAITIAFEIGNHHFPLALDGEELLVPDDIAMEQLLNRLAARWERRRTVFVPLARGHSHD